MVDAVGVGDQRVAHPGQVEQPIPRRVIPGQPGGLQRQDDPDLAERNLIVALMSAWPSTSWAMCGGMPFSTASVMNSLRKSWG